MTKMKETLMLTIHSNRKDAEPFLAAGDTINFDGDLFVLKDSKRIGYLQEFNLEIVDNEYRGQS